MSTINSSPSIQMPTIEAFTQLSIRERESLFVNWLKTKSGPYSFFDIYNCPLAQFGQALKHNSNYTIGGGSMGFMICARDFRNADKAIIVIEDWRISDDLVKYNTFEELNSIHLDI